MNLVFFVRCVTYVPNLRKIRQILRSLSWMNSIADRQTDIILKWLYTVFQKKRTPKTYWHNFIKVWTLWMISFYRMHRHLMRIDCIWKALYRLSAKCVVSTATTALCLSAQHATWLNWSRDWRSRLTANRPSLTGPLTSGENDSRPVSRLRDSISNSCCNLYCHLSFIVCINSKFTMIEKSRCNHVNCSDCMVHFNFNAVVIMLCMSHNIVI